MPKPAGLCFGFYRLVLRLYPKTFRQTYGGQMVQTLVDMLDDQPDTQGRSAIWLRVYLELPLSIAQENITIIGENVMDKISAISNKKLMRRAVIVAGVVLVLLIIVFRVPIHRTLVPNTVGMFYRHGLNNTLSSQNANIGDPFMSIAGGSPHPTYGCYLIGASGIKTRIGCESRFLNFMPLGQSAADKTKNLEAAKRVEAALKAQGYRSDISGTTSVQPVGGLVESYPYESKSNGVTLTSLIAGTYEGKDYSPDAFYQKTVGNNHCIFDTQIAYSNPKQPAINMTLTCNRTVDLFGNPAAYSNGN